MPSTAANLKANMRLPVIGAPMFIVSTPKLVIAQCLAGVIGSFPALNARPAEKLDSWLVEIKDALARQKEERPDLPTAPFAVNQIVHRTNERLMHDVEACVRHRVPIVITSLGAREEVYEAIHSYGGIVLHDVINNTFARKAIEKGADGLICVAAGAGGHAGVLSPFALVQEIREWFDGPLALSGCIARGQSVLAAEAMGADFAYVGSAFIATDEANADAAYKQGVVDGKADDIVYTNYFSGVHGNYLKPSIRNSGLDPDNLPDSDPSKMDFKSGGDNAKKLWKDIWGCGQGIGAVHEVTSTAAFVERLAKDYEGARPPFAVGSARTEPLAKAAVCGPNGDFRKERPMSAFSAYLLGALVLAVGLGFAAHLLGVPPIWIGVGALVVLGAGIMSGAAKTKQKDTPEH